MTGKAILTVSAALVAVAAFAGIYAMSNANPTPTPTPNTSPSAMPSAHAAERPAREANLAKATFGGGCFWCTEAVFQKLRGVHAVVSGYSGGQVANPSYRDVCNGDTGHAEVIQISYDPGQVSFPELLEVFWKTHDPTTLNQQGNDYGTQYRSVVFYHDDEQRQLAERYKKELDASGAFAKPIVTEIAPFTEFYAAEDYHQRYFELNPDQMYCRIVIGPKVEKFQKVFGDKLKDAAK